VETVDSALFGRGDVRAALVYGDLGEVYRLVEQAGVSARRIARLTSHSAAEVRQIMNGRRVSDVGVMGRIADGLGISRAWLGVDLFQGEPSPADVEQRELLPSRVDMVKIAQVRARTEGLREMGRRFGGQAWLLGRIATSYAQWRRVPAPKTITMLLAAALAEMYTEAGWAYYDCGADGTVCFVNAQRLAGEARDSYEVANACWHAGLTWVRSGHPQDALTLFQIAQLRLRKFPPGPPTPGSLGAEDPRLPTLTAWLSRSSATAYALLNNPEQAQRCLAEANEGWEPRDAFERASADLATAEIQLDLGRLEAAQQFATSAVRTYDAEAHRRGRTLAELLLAEVSVRTGDPQGLALARHAIDEVSELSSMAARRERLLPLAAALEARPGPEPQELVVHLAREVAATRV
jgi:transcriptional regulator with XRE-family HTH domain